MATGRASKIGVWIILGLLFVGLAGFSVTNFGGRIETIGRVGSTEIGTQRYFREMQNELAALRQQLGSEVSFAEAQSVGLDRAVLGRVVGEVALENETAALGISVG
ncbi:MAG: peptidylprolyl isomerase, partial [Rhodobacteraceae bacterium]|nr:peptidylprolyl isomerase [Paracoccaceae bacterium]